MKITAASGIYIVTPLQEVSHLNLGKTEEKKLLKGKVVSVGADRDHDNGGKMIAEYKVGDIIYFMSYSENYDQFEEDNQIYFTVLFHDTRAKVE